MTKLFASSLVAIFLAIPGLLQAAPLAETWITTPTGTVDGTAFLDIDGDGRLEIAVLTVGGSYAPGAIVAGLGTLAIIDATGALVWQVQSDKEFAGFPAVGDFDGDGLDEVAVCQVADPGLCMVYDNDGTVLYQLGPFSWPGMTNGGPAVGDLNGDGIDDLVITTFGGEISAANGPDGASLGFYDLYANHASERVFGHPSLGDIDGDGVLDLVLGGYVYGGLYAINPLGGVLKWRIPSLFTLYGNYFDGSGPLLVDLDGNGSDEIVVTLSSTSVSAVAAFDGGGNLLWRTALPGAQLAFVSPSAADINGDGIPDIVVQSLDGTLYILDSNGIVTNSLFLGGQSWLTPGFVDTNLDGILEVMTGTINSLMILDGSMAEIYRYDNPAAGIFPPPIQADIDGDNLIEILAGGFWPGQFYGFDLADTSSFTWQTFGGTGQHPGSLAAGDRFLANLAPNHTLTVNDITLLANSGVPAKAVSELNKAIVEINVSLQSYLQGNPHTAAPSLKAAIKKLNKAKKNGAGNVDYLKTQVVNLGILMLQQYLDRTQTMYGANNADIQSAQADLDNARTLLASNKFSKAADAIIAGTSTLRTLLDNTLPAGDFCATTVNHTNDPWFDLLCNFNKDWTTLQTWTTQFNDASLNQAYSDVRHGAWWMPDINVFASGSAWFVSGDSNLAAVTATNTTAIRGQIIEHYRRATRKIIDDSAVLLGTNSANITTAESLYAQALIDIQAGNLHSGIVNLRDAAGAAMP